MIDLINALAGLVQLAFANPLSWGLATAGFAIAGYSYTTKTAGVTAYAAAHINLLQTEKVDRDGAIPFTGAVTGTIFNMTGLTLGYAGATGTVKTFTYQADALADDGTVTLPDATSGMCFVTCNAEGGMWVVQADGTCAKIVGSANTADTDSDTDVCVYDGGTAGVVKNRLGTTGEIRVIYFYN